MKPSRRLLFALLLAPLLSPAALAEEPLGFRVIVHPSNKINTISREELSKIFLRKQLAWRFGEATLPVDLRPESPVREAFTLWVHRRSMQAVSFYWQGLVFSGRGAPPPELKSDVAVMEYVADNPGAVGYVSPGTKLNGVKTIQVVE